MLSRDFSAVAGLHSRRACARLKGVGKTLVVALCKAALLVVTLESSAQALVESEDVAECVKVDLANPQHGTSPNSHRTLPARSPCIAGDGLGTRGAIRLATPHARTDGHRLANGLCAPRLC
jgi:hypothetical protein